MNIKISLFYKAKLILTSKNININELVNIPFFKLKLKYFIFEFDDNNIIFKSSLTYIDINKIIDILSIECEKRNWNLFISKNLSEYLDKKRLYIEERYRVGNELKKQDIKFIDEINNFKNILKLTMSRDLREKQVWDAFFMVNMQRCCNFSVPGAGKTTVVLAMYAYLRYNKKLNKIVLIGPKNSFGTWIDEFKLCFNNKIKLSVYNLHDKKYKNKKSKIEDLKYNSGTVNLFLFNYESLKSFNNEISELVDSTCLLVYDEVHKIKKVNGFISSYAMEFSDNARYVVALTGTPIPNTYLDIYNVLNLLYREEYKSFFGFDENILKNPSDIDIKNINNKIKPFFCRTTKEQLGIPKVNKDIILEIESSFEENELFKIIYKTYRKNNLLLFIRLLQLGSNPKMLLKKLDVNEFSYILDDDFDDIEKIDFFDYSKDVIDLINSIDTTSKIRECVSYIKTLISENKKILIWCIFLDTMYNLQIILEKYKIKFKIINGKVSLDDRNKIVNDFKLGKYDIIITNPHTLGESVSLHKICHDAIYLEYSYNLVHMLQSKDRIHRLGLEDDQYTQYYYLTTQYNIYEENFSMDMKIYDRLLEKEKLMTEAIENDILENLTSTDEDLELIFSQLH